MGSPGEARPTYRPRMGGLWWTRNRRYLLYFWRELSGPVMALWLFILLGGLLNVARGDAAAAQALVRSPAFAALSAVALAFSLLHALTFWGLMGWVGLPAPGRRIIVGPRAILPFALLWVVASLLVWLLLFRGF